MDFWTVYGLILYALYFRVNKDEKEYNDLLPEMYLLLLTLKKQRKWNRNNWEIVEIIQMCILFQKKTNDCKAKQVWLHVIFFCSCICFWTVHLIKLEWKKNKAVSIALALAGQYLKDVFSSFKFLSMFYL